jgi:uroporphyrinogen decarboxylase
MTPREAVLEALGFRRPPYVPWAWSPTVRCAGRLREHLGADDLDGWCGSHFLDVGATELRGRRLDADHFLDVYGVCWDQTVDKDIGTPCDWPIRRPEDLAGYEWPDASDESWYAGADQRLAAGADRFRRYCIGFSLYERAWTMRGLTDLLADMVERPEFVEALLDAIVEHNLVQVRRALAMDIDAVYFGDDYGMQTGLIMGGEHWRHFIRPRLATMFAPVREAGKFVCMHSCGAVESILDDLADIGVNCFNPFQPEVMDVFAVKPRYHGRLAFHGGMSVQRVLPFGSPAEVREQARRLLALGGDGGYVFSPSHAVPGDVPPENLVAMMEALRAQDGAP